MHLHTSLQEGWTALMKASSERHDDCVELLLNKSVNINQKNKVQCKCSVTINHCLFSMFLCVEVAGVTNCVVVLTQTINVQIEKQSH